MLKQFFRLILPARRRPVPVPVRAFAMALVGLFALAVVPARAQEARQITFDEAVRIALDQNILLQRAANSVDLQEVQVSSERMDFVPNLNLSTSGRQNYGRNFSQEELAFVNQTTESASISVGSSVTLFNGFGRKAALEQARENLDARQLSYDRSRQAVVFDVLSTYLLLIERQEQVRIQEENLAAQRQLEAQIQEFTNVGSRPISDLFQQQALVANAELTILQAQRLVQLAEASLIQTLQLDPFGQYAFVAPEVDDVELVARDYAIPSMLENAFARRADLQAQEQQIQAADAGIRLAKSSIWPSISLSGGYGTGWNSQFRDPAAPGESVPFGEQLQQQRGGSLSLNLSVPIFDRFATRNNVQRAEVQYENARLDYEALQQDIAVQVRQAYLDYQTMQKELEVTEKQLAAAELALEAEQERYNVGASTLVELSQDRAAYVQAASDRVSARYNFIFQQKLIEYYLGVLDPSQPIFR